jgi:hypothetical protein
MGRRRRSVVARERFAMRMAPSRLALDRYWVCVVPEYFQDPEEPYRWRAWGYAADEVPPFEQVRPLLSTIFEQHAGRCPDKSRRTRVDPELLQTTRAGHEM